MNNLIKTILIVIAIVGFSFILIMGGYLLGRNRIFVQSFPNSSIMESFLFGKGQGLFSFGYMGMHGGWNNSGGMMGDFNFGGQNINTTPLSIEKTNDLLEDYIAINHFENLEIGEIMIFSNHAYAQLIESDTGIGAMEVLIDPESGNVYPEYGPNMMWNLKNGSQHGGMYRTGMMGSNFYFDGEPDRPMTVSEEEAVELAQDYLDSGNSGLVADEHADSFYGYYTIHTLKDGQVVGMLSVNGFSGDVFIHTWHGDFVEMSDH